jgi:hypothetical protein
MGRGGNNGIPHRGTRRSKAVLRRVNGEGVVCYRRAFDDAPHRVGGPAVTVPAGVTARDLFPFLGPVEGPAQVWMREGRLDRADGPALVSSNGVEESFRSGRRHAEGRPAVVIPAGVTWRPTDWKPVQGPAELWYEDGVLGRFSGPAVILGDVGNRTEIYYRRGVRHRDDGPAYLSESEQSWWKRGRLDREDGPAVIKADGLEAWFWQGALHRGDGPALEYPDGLGEWCWHGARLEGRPPVPWPPKEGPIETLVAGASDRLPPRNALPEELGSLERPFGF